MVQKQEPSWPRAKIFETLKDRIRKGKLTGQLPSLAQLTAEFHVSTSTVKKVIDQLKVAGLVYGEQGRGIFSSAPTRPLRGTVGLLLLPQHMEIPFYLHFSLRLRQVLARHGLECCQVDSVAGLLASPANAAVVPVGMSGFTPEQFQETRRRFGNRHVQIIDRIPGVSYVSTDYYGAGMMAARYLYEHGHRKIGVIARDIYGEGENLFTLRYHGFRDFAAAHADMQVHFIGNTDYAIGFETLNFAVAITQQLLAEMPDNTAIFAFTDVVALGTLTVLQRAHIRIPEDISLMGFDNREMTALMNPPLTTMEEPVQLLAEETVAILIQALDDPHAAPHEVLIPPRLIERESVRTIPLAATAMKTPGATSAIHRLD